MEYISICYVNLLYDNILTNYTTFQSAGVQFPQRPPTVSSNPPTSLENRNRSNGVELASSKHEEVAWQASQVVQESRYSFMFQLLVFLCVLEVIKLSSAGAIGCNSRFFQFAIGTICFCHVYILFSDANLSALIMENLMERKR